MFFFIRKGPKANIQNLRSMSNDLLTNFLYSRMVDLKRNKIPIHERYETVDYEPNTETREPNNTEYNGTLFNESYKTICYNYKIKNDHEIPIEERYETIDFNPKKK